MKGTQIFDLHILQLTFCEPVFRQGPTHRHTASLHSHPAGYMAFLHPVPGDLGKDFFVENTSISLFYCWFGDLFFLGGGYIYIYIKILNINQYRKGDSEPYQNYHQPLLELSYSKV